MKHSIQDILEAIAKNNNQVVDDHRGDSNNLRNKPYAIGKHGEHIVWLCSPEETPYFSINSVYIDEKGIPHLSRWSVGGVVDLNRYGSLDAALKVYNDPANWTAGFKLTPVTDITYLR